MNFEFFQINLTDAADETKRLNQFLASNRIVNVEKRFHAFEEQMFWCFCVTKKGIRQSTKDKTKRAI